MNKGNVIIIRNSDKNNLPLLLIHRLMLEVCNAQVSLEIFIYWWGTSTGLTEQRLSALVYSPAEFHVTLLFCVCFICTWKCYSLMICFSQKLHLADAQDIPNGTTGWENVFVNLDSPSFAFVFPDNGIKKSCDSVLFFNFTQEFFLRRIKVQIQVFILHIPLSTALCQGSASRVVVNCDAVLFIALLIRKIGET